MLLLARAQQTPEEEKGEQIAQYILEFVARTPPA